MSKPWDGRANPFNAYYYSLEPTGVEHVDSILKSLAYAGKAYDSTSQWTDDHPESCIDLIQAEANEAAKRIAELQELADFHVQKLEEKNVRIRTLEAELAARDKRIAELEAEKQIHNCTCGSGMHPRRCDAHPWRYDAHCNEIHTEVLEAENTRLRAALEDAGETLHACWTALGKEW